MDDMTVDPARNLAADIEQAKTLVYLCDRDNGDLEAARVVLASFVARGTVTADPDGPVTCPCGLALSREAGSLWRCWAGHPWMRTGAGWLPAVEVTQ